MKQQFLALFIAAACGAVQAAPVPPVSYDMHNGDGFVSGGAFNYWDLNYSGSGATNVDNAPLSGGLGDLTDGVVSALSWNQVENLAGTGPFVGWRASVLPVAVPIRFNFAGPVSIDTITIHADDTADNVAGGVSLPTTVTFTWTGGSASFTVVDPDPGSFAPSFLVYGGLGITNASFVDVSLTYRTEWIFVDEVSFDAAPVPEPATWALLAAGIGALALRRRR